MQINCKIALIKPASMLTYVTKTNFTQKNALRTCISENNTLEVKLHHTPHYHGTAAHRVAPSTHVHVINSPSSWIGILTYSSSWFCPLSPVFPFMINWHLIQVRSHPVECGNILRSCVNPTWIPVFLFPLVTCWSALEDHCFDAPAPQKP